MENKAILYAVITGDIIESSKVNHKGRKDMIEHLKGLFDTVNNHIIQEKQPPVEIFRGDSFQMLLKDPAKALLIGIIIRAMLRSLTSFNHQETQNYIDARISIGVGEVTFWADKIIESDGSAFQLSGRGLDSMKKRQSLSIRTIWPEVNEEMEVACALSETIINRWTTSQSKVIYPYLLENKTQQALAEQFEITQGAVSQRLSEGGNIDAIKLFIQRYEKLISNRR